MAAELAAARGDAAVLARGGAVDVFFEDGTSDTGTLDGVDASTCNVRYADDEVERLDRSHVAPRGSAWLRKLRKRYPWPRALEATGFEHFSVARALASAELCGNQPVRRQHRVDGAERPKFDFHIGAEKGAFTATRAYGARNQHHVKNTPCGIHVLCMYMKIRGKYKKNNKRTYKKIVENMYGQQRKI